MSILKRALDVRSTAELAPDLHEGHGYWGAGMVWNSPTGPIKFFPATEAMQLSAVYACLRLLSEAISTLPLDTYIRLGGSRRVWRPRPEYLSFNPPQGSRIDYLSQTMLSLLTDGNAYIVTPRDDMGIPVDLIVLDPQLVEVCREKGQIYYKVGPQQVKLTQYDLMHIKGMTLPGALTGCSPIGYARESIGLGLAGQRYGTSVFDNGATPGGVIEAPEDMEPEAAQRFSAMWNARHRGGSNAQRVGVLTAGAHFNKVTMTPDEAQFLGTRAFQVPDIARFYGVPPHLIADASNSTSWGSGLAEQNSAFGQLSLRPWIERVEDGHNRLLTTHGMPDVFIKLNVDALLRSNLESRYDSYAVGIGSDFLTINEARKLEDLPPVAWGDQPWHPTRETVAASTGPDPLNPAVAPPGGTP